MVKYYQDPRIIGYVRTKELEKKLDYGSSFFSVGLDAPRCWGDEPPYDFLEPLYRTAPMADVPVFRIKHGPRGSDGAPESYSFESLTDAGVENFPHGTMLYTDPGQEIARLCDEVAGLRKIIVEFRAECIYNSWYEQDGWVPWVKNGNSHKQVDARQAARIQLKVEGVEC